MLFQAPVWGPINGAQSRLDWLGPLHSMVARHRTAAADQGCWVAHGKRFPKDRSLTPLGKLKLTRKRIRLLGLLVVLAGVVGACLGLLIQSGSYSAKSTVFVSSVLNSSSNSTDLSSSVGDFETAIKLPEVERAVAQAANEPVSEIRSRLKASSPTGGTAVTVSFSDHVRDKAENVVNTAAKATMQALVRQHIDSAQSQVIAATTAVTTAQGALNQFNVSTGYPDYEGEYQSVQQSVLSLQGQNSPQLAQQQQLLNTLSAQQPRYQMLNSVLQQAQQSLGNANQSLTAAQGSYTAINSSTILTPPTVTHTGAASYAIRSGVGSAVAALVLGLLAFFGVDYLKRRKVSGEEEPVRSTETTSASLQRPPTEEPSVAESSEDKQTPSAPAAKPRPDVDPRGSNPRFDHRSDDELLQPIVVPHPDDRYRPQARDPRRNNGRYQPPVSRDDRNNGRDEPPESRSDRDVDAARYTPQTRSPRVVREARPEVGRFIPPPPPAFNTKADDTSDFAAHPEDHESQNFDRPKYSRDKHPIRAPFKGAWHSTDRRHD